MDIDDEPCTRIITTVIPPSMNDALDSLAKADRRSKSYFVREAIAAYLAERRADGTLKVAAR